MMKIPTAAELMDDSIRAAKKVLKRHFPKCDKEHADAYIIAASNIAIPIFSYEAEIQARSEGDPDMPDEDIDALDLH